MAIRNSNCKSEIYDHGEFDKKRCQVTATTSGQREMARLAPKTAMLLFFVVVAVASFELAAVEYSRFAVGISIMSIVEKL